MFQPRGTATFMIAQPFALAAVSSVMCAHGRPVAPDARAAGNWRKRSLDMALRYVVITSVDRDVTRDGGAQHLLTASPPSVQKPGDKNRDTVDFRGRMDRALDILNFDAAGCV